MIDHQPAHYLTLAGAAWRKWPPAAAGAVLIVGSALAFALDGPVAQAAYRQGLDPATFGFWRASAGALVLVAAWPPGCGQAPRPGSGGCAGPSPSGWRWRPWLGWA